MFLSEGIWTHQYDEYGSSFLLLVKTYCCVFAKIFNPDGADPWCVSRDHNSGHRVLNLAMDIYGKRPQVWNSKNGCVWQAEAKRLWNDLGHRWLHNKDTWPVNGPKWLALKKRAKTKNKQFLYVELTIPVLPRLWHQLEQFWIVSTLFSEYCDWLWYRWS